jgi:hypothetical protein
MKIEKPLVPLDGSALAESAIAAAVEMAQPGLATLGLVRAATCRRPLADRVRRPGQRLEPRAPPARRGGDVLRVHAARRGTGLAGRLHFSGPDGGGDGRAAPRPNAPSARSCSGLVSRCPQERSRGARCGCSRRPARPASSRRRWPRRSVSSPTSPRNRDATAAPACVLAVHTRAQEEKDGVHQCDS